MLRPNYHLHPFPSQFFHYAVYLHFQWRTGSQILEKLVYRTVKLTTVILRLRFILVRFEMPYNIWCGGCGNHIGMGRLTISGNIIKHLVPPLTVKTITLHFLKKCFYLY